MLTNNKSTILMVDDNPSNLNLLVAFLTDQGYNLSIAQNGKTAIKRAKYLKPDIILLDILMPDMDGYKVCQILKEDEETRDIPVIFMSALNDTVDKVKGFEIGAVDYIIKPFENIEVLARIKTHLKICKMQKELMKADTINKRMFSIISHDIRSPLSSIKVLNELINDGYTTLEESKKLFKNFSKDVDNLLLFLEEILSWSMQQIKNEPDVMETFNVSQIIKDISNLFENQFVKKNLKFKIDDINSEVYFSKNNYSFIIRNVIHNAIKFSPKGGEISISTTKNGDITNTIISNQGAAISPEVAEKITKSDEWYSERGTDGEKGSGFGIKTCIKYLEEVGGKLEFIGEEGKGTTVHIIIPYKK